MIMNRMSAVFILLAAILATFMPSSSGAANEMNLVVTNAFPGLDIKIQHGEASCGTTASMFPTGCLLSRPPPPVIPMPAALSGYVSEYLPLRASTPPNTPHTIVPKGPSDDTTPSAGFACTILHSPSTSSNQFTDQDLKGTAMETPLAVFCIVMEVPNLQDAPIYTGSVPSVNHLQNFSSGTSCASGVQPAPGASGATSTKSQQSSSGGGSSSSSGGGASSSKGASGSLGLGGLSLSGNGGGGGSGDGGDEKKGPWKTFGHKDDTPTAGVRKGGKTFLKDTRTGNQKWWQDSVVPVPGAEDPNFADEPGHQQQLQHAHFPHPYYNPNADANPNPNPPHPAHPQQAAHANEPAPAEQPAPVDEPEQDEPPLPDLYDDKKGGRADKGDESDEDS